MGELAKDTRSMATVWRSHVTFELQTGLEFRNTVGFPHPLSRMSCNRNIYWFHKGFLGLRVISPGAIAMNFHLDYGCTRRSFDLSNL